MEKHMCPVCGKYEFQEVDLFDVAIFVVGKMTEFRKKTRIIPEGQTR